ncbi:DoxX family protein [Dinghuibacter silviterrae]|uniref:Putative oxidoreductase n=1 Tax=Dinghuibacter silviterrae TaxID=1539049 RepID=A0A4R8DG98_9BACT|nr:DoxX family protein [Dinghuibacter silviterrae]TDW96477.1 putative oxidoreductase [Dinghuibacter silviterrae]
MSKLTSTNYSEGAFNFATLILRLAFGFIILWHHGVEKLMNFSTLQYTFPDPLHIGHRISLVLVLFAEVLCGALVIIGFVTRIALIPLIITLGVALAIVHRHQGLMSTELAWLYLTAFLALLFVGPGRISVDGMLN